MNPAVLVVGAGPVGLTMAAELSRYGVPVRVIDKASAPSDKSKALVLWSRTLELMDRMGCCASFIAAGQKAHGASFVAGGKKLGHVRLDEIETPYAFGLMLPQSETERLMDQHLGTLGVKVERQVELARFTAEEGKVTAVLRHAEGREETLDVDWLLGCDGAHSAVRHGLGMSFEGSTLASDWVLADLHLSGVPTPPDEIALHLHADGVLALFPITPGSPPRYRVVADLGARPPGTEGAEPTLAELQALLDRRGPGGIVASDPLWLARFAINERKVRDYRAGRVFLAGDAAHVCIAPRAARE